MERHGGGSKEAIGLRRHVLMKSPKTFGAKAETWDSSEVQGASIFAKLAGMFPDAAAATKGPLRSNH
jgi:hypothetical protein